MNDGELIDKQAGYNFALNTPYSNPINTYQGAITELTNPDRELIVLELSLKGKYIDADGNEKKSGEPLCNDEGVNNILRIARSTISQVSFMSNYEKEHLPKLMRYLTITLTRDLTFNMKKYEIKDDRARSIINYITHVQSNAACRRALDNGERRFWKGSQQETTIRTENGQTQNKGFWKSILPGGK